MPNVITVEQAELIVVADNVDDTVLITQGISTCICLCAKGLVGGMPFLAMYHWEGFSDDFDKQAEDAENKALLEVNDLFDKFSSHIIRAFKQHSLPQLHAMYLIGGEKATPDLSGTELEVETLESYVKNLADEYFDTSADLLIKHQHYLTDESNSLSIQFTWDDTLILDDYLSESEEDDLSSDSECSI